VWDYSEKVKDHFLHPRNTGVIENPDGLGEVGAMACGDALKLTFKIDSEERITDAKFQTFGCASAIASSSALTEMLLGLSIEEAEKITNRDIVNYLDGLPDQKIHCSVMGQEALEAAIAYYRSGGKVAQPAVRGSVICKCFGVTDLEIEAVVRDNNLRTVAEVTNHCKAGGACGGCHKDIERIIARIQGEPIAEESCETKGERMTNIEKMKRIEETIEREIRPALQQDGGDLDLIDVEGDRVKVAFRGSCAHCPMAQFTMQQVVQAKLREFVSEDLILEEVQA